MTVRRQYRRADEPASFRQSRTINKQTAHNRESCAVCLVCLSDENRQSVITEFALLSEGVSVIGSAVLTAPFIESCAQQSPPTVEAASAANDYGLI